MLKLAIVLVAEKSFSHSVVFDSVAKFQFVISKIDFTTFFRLNMKLPKNFIMPDFFVKSFFEVTNVKSWQH